VQLVVTGRLVIERDAAVEPRGDKIRFQLLGFGKMRLTIFENLGDRLDGLRRSIQALIGKRLQKK
jgi:hypothetical protein